MNLKKKFALIAAGSLLGVSGLYAVTVSANAAPSPTPAIALTHLGIQAPMLGDPVDSNGSDQTASEMTSNDLTDGVDAGVDANATEPGHQDAAGIDDVSEASNTAEVVD